jgi:hypothetical protein
MCFSTVLSTAKFGIIGVAAVNFALHTAHVGDRFCEGSNVRNNQEMATEAGSHFLISIPIHNYRRKYDHTGSPSGQQH